MLDWQNFLSFHRDRVQSQALAQPPMFSFSLPKYMHDYTGITHVPGRGWVPPPRPRCRASVFGLFDRSDFTRFTPTLSAYRLHSGADSPLEGLSLPWMPRTPASMSCACTQPITAPAQANRARQGPCGVYRKPVFTVPPKNGGVERAPQCRLPGPKRTLAPSGV